MDRGSCRPAGVTQQALALWVPRVHRRLGWPGGQVDRLSTLPSPGWCIDTTWEPLSSFAAMERRRMSSALSQPAVNTAGTALAQPLHLELGLAALMVWLLGFCDGFEVCSVLGDCPLPCLVVTASEGSWTENALISLTSTVIGHRCPCLL